MASVSLTSITRTHNIFMPLRVCVCVCIFIYVYVQVHMYASNWITYITPKGSFWKRSQKIKKVEVLGDYRETVSSRHSRAVTHRISQKLWLWVQDLCNLTPEKIQLRRKEVGTKSCRLLSSYGQMIIAGTRTVLFKDVALGRLNMVQWKATHTQIYRQHRLDFYHHPPSSF